MAETKSFNSENKSVAKTLRRTFGLGISAAAVMSAAVAVMFAVALDGCSGGSKRTEVSSSNLKSSTISATPSPAPVGLTKTEPKVKRHSVVKRMSTLGYSDGVAGMAFRYPREYTLVTPEKTKQDSEVLSRIPMNYVAPGGEKVATVELPGSLATSLLEISVNKTLTAQQCDQFADPDLNDMKAISPVDPSDDSIPSKVNFHGTTFMRVENGTEQTDTRYYHHFENGACYEFVLAVAEKPGNTKAIDHFEQFDKLERILASVQIKSEKQVTVTAGAPNNPISESKPQ